MKSVFAFLFLAAPVFAQDTTFVKEDPNLLSVHVTITVVDGKGREAVFMDSVKKYQDGDLKRLLVVSIVSRDDSYTHKYDDAGKVIERLEKDENNEPSRAWVYSYNEDGSWRMDGYGYDEDGNRGASPIYVERWDKNGKILTAQWKVEGAAKLQKFSYDGKGRLTKIEEIPDGASKPISWTVYKYNDAGKLASDETYSGDVLRETTVYTDDGEPAEKVRHDGDGNPTSKSVYTYRYKDFQGNKRKVEQLATSYRLKDGKWIKGSIAKVKIEYQYKKK